MTLENNLKEIRSAVHENMKINMSMGCTNCWDQK